MSCPICEDPPSEVRFSRIYLWPPQGHVAAKLARLIADRRIAPLATLGDDCLAAELDDVAGFATAAAAGLLLNEQQDTRVLTLPAGGALSFADFSRVTTLWALVESIRGRWVGALLAQRRYRSVTQPIVDVRDGRVFGQEFLLRGWTEDGAPLSAGTIFGAAREPRILANLDRAARINAVQTAKAQAIAGKLFVNFTPNAIYEPAQCLRTTVAAVHEHGIVPHDVVFEIVESEAVHDYAHLKSIVDFYRASGFQIALDDFGTGFNNLAALFALRPDFIKLDILLTRATQGDGFGRSLIKELIATAHGDGIRVIAEGVEDRATLSLLRDLGVDFAQGYYLARPAELPTRTIDPALLADG